jgi:cell division septal protein FtsQ
MPPNNQRHVRRSGVRPVYGRRPLPSRSWSLPKVSSRWLKVAGVAVLVLLLFSWLASVTQIKKVQVTGNSAISTSELQKAVHAALRQQLFGKSTLTFNAGAVGGYLEQSDLGIKEANVSRSLPGTIKIKVVERIPSLIWQSGGGKYLLDSDGTIIGPVSAKYQALPVVEDSTGLPVKVGGRAVPSQFVSFSREFIRRLPETGLAASQVTVPVTTSEIYISTNKGFGLKIDTTRPPGDEIADLKLVLGELAKSHQSPSQYIDLRVEHKAYYK